MKDYRVNDFVTFKFVPDRTVLSVEIRQRLCAFLDFMWHLTAPIAPPGHGNSSSSLVPAPARVDLRMTVPDAQFSALVGGSPALVSELKRLFAEIPGTPSPESAKIALRITQGPSNACIAFHCDGEYATGTVQVSLNEPSQYKGGRLCYFVAGSCTCWNVQPGRWCNTRPECYTP